eukprot:10371426-Heterocapsa_arctica.AAC.1
MGPFVKGDLYSAAENATAKRGNAKRKLQKRDTDDQVERSLKTHFSGWSALETDGHQENGRTLRQQLAEDRKAVKNGDLRLGSSYWKELQAKFGGPSRPTQSLQVVDKNQEVKASLVDALDAATSNNTTL